MRIGGLQQEGRVIDAGVWRCWRICAWRNLAGTAGCWINGTGSRLKRACLWRHNGGNARHISHRIAVAQTIFCFPNRTGRVSAWNKVEAVGAIRCRHLVLLAGIDQAHPRQRRVTAIGDRHRHPGNWKARQRIIDNAGRINRLVLVNDNLSWRERQVWNAANHAAIRLTEDKSVTGTRRRRNGIGAIGYRRGRSNDSSNIIDELHDIASASRRITIEYAVAIRVAEHGARDRRIIRHDNGGICRIAVCRVCNFANAVVHDIGAGPRSGRNRQRARRIDGNTRKPAVGDDRRC